MPVQSIDIQAFLELSKSLPIMDVRSPGEYAQAHIPGAYSLPLFTDEERKIIGTAYKQQSRQIAVDIGLGYFSVHMKTIGSEAESLLQIHRDNSGTTNANTHSPVRTVLLHCWRGGMRSEAVAWLLNLYGFQVYVLRGGYKSYRRWALGQFETQYSFQILGGYTGSGKTEKLGEMKCDGQNVIDLEALAHHKGSAFGGFGQGSQPSQEMFENELALCLWNNQQNNSDPIWLEDESAHIGNLHLPPNIWKQMRQSPLFFMEIPYDDRLRHLLTHYGNISEELLAQAIQNISKRLGGAETKSALQLLYQNDLKSCFGILLNYYDRLYKKALQKRDNLDQIFHLVSSETLNNQHRFWNVNKITHG